MFFFMATKLSKPGPRGKPRVARIGLTGSPEVRYGRPTESNTARGGARAMEEKVYPVKTSMKVLFWILAIVCTVIIVGIPVAIMFYMMIFRSKIVLKSDRIVNIWVKTREVQYSDISALAWGPRAGGIIGVMMGRPLMSHDRAGKKRWWGFMAEAVENTPELLAELEVRTGQKPV
jgi:hypothetical protein